MRENDGDIHRTVASAACFLTVAAIAAPGADAQSLASGQSFEAPLLRLFAGFIVCSLVALVAALLLKRHMSAGKGLPLLQSALGGGDGRRIAVLETRRLSAHADVCRFTSAGREYLVVVAAGAALVLRDSEIETPGQAAPPGNGA